MTQEELKEFLKKNLKIETSVNGAFDEKEKEVCIRLYFGDEIIASDFFVV